MPSPESRIGSPVIEQRIVGSFDTQIETVRDSPGIDPRIGVIFLYREAGLGPAQRVRAYRSEWASVGSRADARARLHLSKRSVAENDSICGGHLRSPRDRLQQPRQAAHHRAGIRHGCFGPRSWTADIAAAGIR